MSRTRVLVVDSHPAVGYSLAFTLNQEASFEVQFCSDYQCIAYSLSTFVPRIVIIDLHLEDVRSYLSVCKQVAAQLARSIIIILVPPTLMTDMLVAEAIEAGADGVLSHGELDFARLVSDLEKVDHGQSLFSIQQIRDALTAKQAVDVQSTMTNLTPRKKEIAKLIVRGQSTEEIANNLSITQRTVYAHVGNIMSKLGVKSRTEAALQLYNLRM